MCSCSLDSAAEHLLCEQNKCKAEACKGNGSSMQQHEQGQQRTKAIASCKGSSSMPRQQQHAKAVAHAEGDRV